MIWIPEIRDEAAQLLETRMRFSRPFEDSYGASCVRMLMYEVRHGDDDWGDPCQLATWIMVNHYGTLISAQPVKLEKSPTINNFYRDIDPDKDWNFDGGVCTLKEYMNKYPPFQER